MFEGSDEEATMSLTYHIKIIKIITSTQDVLINLRYEQEIMAHAILRVRQLSIPQEHIIMF